jgi:(1->4)-alpha-D-glucan 1-alpha-D-glucosylmutase
VIPRATMRLQLHRGFTFADAERLVPYLRDLGISHVYLSPILTARPGSVHGYDVVDPTRVNPELGGEGGFCRLVGAMRSAGLGVIVDIVPNHMAADESRNAWWRDVMIHGPNSRYAEFFDIDWHPADPALENKVLVPVLGKPYGEALRDGEITFDRDASGEPMIRYFDRRFPLRPADRGVDAADHESLHALLERQHYRLAWWRTAGDEINWRRFFDINGLVGLRVEDPAVFDAAHETLFRLYESGLIDGLRVDHVDGLAHPGKYCRRLRARLDELAPNKRAYLVVEKILGTSEILADDWGVDGTTGYDFMNEVSALLHDPAGETSLTELWAAMSGRPASFASEEVAARHEILERSFSAQCDAVVAALHSIAMSDTVTRDVTSTAIRRALDALIAHFPNYRSYGLASRTPRDAAAFTAALTGARAELHAADWPVLDLIDRWLGGEMPQPCEIAARGNAAVRLQQLCSATAAKAVEDTAFYRYGRLLSRNEVGSDPGVFAWTPTQFHSACLYRREHFPDTLLATATHDHKRGEDTRARLAVLSEMPHEWVDQVRRWQKRNMPHRGVGPSPADELMLYQTIIAAWPTELSAASAEAMHAFTERLVGWQVKALREEKLNSGWEDPDLEYEEAARSFLYSIMDDAGFLGEAAALARHIGAAGAVNGLAQTLLKLTAPGVPDFFQGSEFWDQSLVDPDNRRPVDFPSRIAALQREVSVADWRNGHVKQALIRHVLALRSAMPMLFARGDYRPLAVEGAMAAHVVAFARTHGEQAAITIVPRFVLRMLRDDASIAIPSEAWGDTRINLPNDLAGRWGTALRVGDVLREMPVALLVT